MTAIPMNDGAAAAPIAATATVTYRVPFYDTDAMGVVHHANYARYLELSRVRFLEAHDQPYARYVADGVQVAVTRLELLFHRPCRFDDQLSITCWLEWVRTASLRFRYEIRRDRDIVAGAFTEHACVDLRGQLCRLPRGRRLALGRLAVTTSA